MFYLKLLGSVLLEGPGGAVQGKTVQKRRLALLAALAAERGRPVPRQRLVSYLWLDSDNGRHLLNESLRVMRSELGRNALVSVGDQVALDPAVVRSDLQEFEDALQRGELEVAVTLYRGPFLAGLDLSGAEEFERWADGARARVDRAYAKALEQLAERSEEAGDVVAAVDWWTRLAQVDRESSRVVLRLMAALEAAGECGSAIRRAEEFNAYRRREGLKPHPDVEACAQRLRAVPARSPGPLPGFLPRLALHLSGTDEAPPAGAGTAAAPRGTTTAVPGVPAPAPTGAGPAAAQRPAETELRSGGAGSRKHIRRMPLLVGGLSCVLSFAFTVRSYSSAPLDPNLLLVLPFAENAPASADGVNGGDCELLLFRAFGRWKDLGLVDPQRVRQATSQVSLHISLSAALRIARELRAGRLAWGDVTTLGDSVVVRGSVYDVSSGRMLRQQTTTASRDPNDLSAKLRVLAATLLLREPPADSAGETLGTTSLAAWRSFEAGRLALRAWELPQARAHLDHALETDPEYADANLLLAQTLTWSDEEPESWKDYAARAVAASAGLQPRERRLARALLALGEERYPDACREYEALLAADSMDVAAWFGLGDCHGRDDAVLRDRRSPSGWRFRSSHQRAVLAYSRALSIAPESYRAFRGAGFTRLNRLLRTESNQVRVGRALRPDTTRFAAYPALVADTLAYVPVPLREFPRLSPATIPATRADALVRNRQTLRDVARAWEHAFPRSADSHEALARALETLGELEFVRQGEPSAMSELMRARALASDSDQILRLGIAQVRVYLKVGRFDRAKAMADSLLSAWERPGPHDAQRLAPLAVLTGQPQRALALLRVSTPEWRPATRSVPPQVTAAAEEVWVYGCLGLFKETAEAERKFERVVQVWIEPKDQTKVRQDLLQPPHRLAFDAAARRMTGAPLQDPTPVIQMQESLAAGGIAYVRSELNALRRRRSDRRPGDIAIDFVLPEAQLYLALGDTAQARFELDRSLDALPALSNELLDRMEGPAALVRAMELRSELATKRGDQVTARQWGSAVRTLWRDADPRLRLVRIIASHSLPPPPP